MRKSSYILFLILFINLNIYCQIQIDSLPKNIKFVDYFVGFDYKSLTNIPDLISYNGDNHDFLSKYEFIQKSIPTLPEKPQDNLIQNGDTLSWLWGIQYYLKTVDKWKDVEISVTKEQKESFLKDIGNTPYVLTHYLPNLSYHYIDLNYDNNIDLFVDCTDGNGPKTQFFSYSDSVILHHEIINYIKDVQRIQNGILVIAEYDFGPTTIEKMIETFKITLLNEVIEIESDMHFVTWKEIEIPKTDSIDKLFVTTETIYIGTKKQKKNTYFEGSYGYIISETEDQYLVLMINELSTTDSKFEDYIKRLRRQHYKPFNTLGWIKKKSVTIL